MSRGGHRSIQAQQGRRHQFSGQFIIHQSSVDHAMISQRIVDVRMVIFLDLPGPALILAPTEIARFRRVHGIGLAGVLHAFFQGGDQAHMQHTGGTRAAIRAASFSPITCAPQPACRKLVTARRTRLGGCHLGYRSADI